MFTINPLPYPANALEPYFDASTMKLHHDKHHQTYADKLNLLIETHAEFKGQSLSQLVKSAIEPIKNMAGGVENHNLFWEMLSPQVDQVIPDKLGKVLVQSFGSVENFKTEFTQKAISLFGSGWTWLVKKDKLMIINLPNQDTPISQGLTPLLALDLWEHAYYLKYQNRRVEYIEAFWHLVNWRQVDKLCS